MKGFGIFFLVLGILNVLVFFIAAGSGEAQAARGQLSGGIMFGVIGLYLIHRAKQKKEASDNKHKWENNE